MAVSVQGDGGRRYNDGQWHSIRATRQGAVGTIVVNDQYRGNSPRIHTDHCVHLLRVWVCECNMLIYIHIFGCESCEADVDCLCFSMYMYCKSPHPD